MAILRTITVTVTDVDTVSVSNTFAGYEGENSATRIVTVLPSGWVGYTARVSYNAADGWLDQSPAHSVTSGAGQTFNYDLPYTAMKKGVLRVAIEATTGTFVAHTVTFNLNISASVNPQVAYTNDFNNSVQDLEERVSDLEAGGGGGGGTYPTAIDADYITFSDTVGTPTYNKGRLYWDDTDKCLTLMSDQPGVSLQIGQEMVFRARNNTGATILNGKPVYISGAIGGVPTIALAKADADATVCMVGVVTSDIAKNDNGYVTVNGLVRDVNTAAYLDGDTVYLSAATAGEITKTAPTFPNYAIRIGRIGYAHAVNGIIIVDVGIDWSSKATVNAFGIKDLVASIGRFGDYAGGNYSEFEADGTYHSVGTATTYQDIIVNALSLVTGVTAPAMTTFVGTIKCWAFDINTLNDLFGSVEIPHDYMEGTDIEVHVHWATTNTDTKRVIWGLEWTVAGMESATPFGVGSALEATDNGKGTALLHHYCSLGTIAGANRKIGDIVAFRVYRKANDAADDYTGKAFFLSIGFHYKQDTIGSRTPTSK